MARSIVRHNSRRFVCALAASTLVFAWQIIGLSGLSDCVALSALAQSGSSAKPSKPKHAKNDQLDEKAMKLIERLSHYPELMVVPYLSCYVGVPQQASRNFNNASYAWHAYSPNDPQPTCELNQEFDGNGLMVNAVFDMDLPESDVELPDIEKKEGTAGKKFYDKNCRPALQYAIGPNTTVTFVQEQNKFYVHHVQVRYAGPPLPPPSAADMQAAQNDRRTLALSQNGNGKQDASVSLLWQHLSQDPNDAEARYALAQAYQKSGNLNQAIVQYQTALACAGDNAAVSQKCIEGLQQLHVIATPGEQLDFHNLKLKPHGQGFSQGDVTETDQRQDLVAGQGHPGQAAGDFNANAWPASTGIDYGHPAANPLAPAQVAPPLPPISPAANALDPGF